MNGKVKIHSKVVLKFSMPDQPHIQGFSSVRKWLIKKEIMLRTVLIVKKAQYWIFEI